MAKLNSGINGSFSGSVGEVVGCTWKGIPYIRRKPRKTKKKPTENQLKNRYEFKMIQKWLEPVNDFAKLGFKDYSLKVSGINAANSLLRKEAFHKDGFNSSIDPALVRMSSGSLRLPENVEVFLDEERQLVFTWTPSSGKDQHPRDQVMLLAYNVKEKQPVYILNGEFRDKGSDRLNLVHAAPGIYHVYIAFLAADRSRQSDSLYLGTVEL